MAVVLVHDGITQQQYEDVVRKMAGKDRLESPSDWPVPGLLAHAAGQGDKGFRVIDVWESEEACNRFGEQLGPYLEQAGVQAEPELYPAHAFVKA